MRYVEKLMIDLNYKTVENTTPVSLHIGILARIE